MGRKMKIRLLIMLLVFLSIILFYTTPLVYHWRRATWLGGGQKFVIILAANVGGGVMEWKGAREWAIERDSVRNKKRYVAKWGYDLEIVDMSTKKRYAHEWRESWEKVDFIRASLRKYPKAEWIWWLDLNTFIMEPTYSLQDHIFNNLEKHVYRDINAYNPLNITHPIKEAYLDAESNSPVGDGNPNSVNLLLSQDCSGFNLGSFFVRRGPWIDRLLDVWWDPVAYEQKHMEWEHKEQDALEQLYTSQPWIPKHTGFLPQRMINSFPTGACSENGNDTRIHYDKKDRDFLVNMAGCEWGRDCWGEMYNFRAELLSQPQPLGALQGGPCGCHLVQIDRAESQALSIGWPMRTRYPRDTHFSTAAGEGEFFLYPSPCFSTTHPVCITASRRAEHALAVPACAKIAGPPPSRIRRWFFFFDSLHIFIRLLKIGPFLFLSHLAKYG